MSKMIRRDAIIEVVDYDTSPTLKNAAETTRRYKTFFRDRLKVPIYHEGARKYIEDNFDY